MTPSVQCEGTGWSFREVFSDYNVSVVVGALASALALGIRVTLQR